MKQNRQRKRSYQRPDLMVVALDAGPLMLVNSQGQTGATAPGMSWDTGQTGAKAPSMEWEEYEK